MLGGGGGGRPAPPHPLILQNCVSYAKAERIKSKKDGGVFPVFRLEINKTLSKPKLSFLKIQSAKSPALYTRWKNFDLQFRSGSATTAKMSGIRLKIVGQNKNVSSAVRTIHTKNARIEKQ